MLAEVYTECRDHPDPPMARRTLVARKRENGAYDLYRGRNGDTDRGGPTATALGFEAIFEHVAFGHHDAVIVEGGSRRTYLPVGFAVPTVDPATPAGGACIGLRPEAGLSEAYLRGWVHATKGVLGDAIEEGWLTESAARAYFRERVEGFAATTEVIVP